MRRSVERSSSERVLVDILPGLTVVRFEGKPLRSLYMRFRVAGVVGSATKLVEGSVIPIFS